MVLKELLMKCIIYYNMNLFLILKSIWYHPFNQSNRVKAILRFFKWQIGTYFLQYPIIYKLTSNSKLIVSKGMTGATGNIYNGLLEFNDMIFLLHFLREEDVFYDIGANIGVYSILSSAEIGAKTYAIEPIPSTFSFLEDNININKCNDIVTLLNIGLSNKEGEMFFTSNLDTINHVINDFNNFSNNNLKIKVDTLDNISIKDIPSFIKLDVEGFEMPVLEGAYNVLKNNNLKGIIIELNGSGKNFGFEDLEIHKLLLRNNFKPFYYSPRDRKLYELESFGNHNTIYLRDLNFVIERVKNQRKISVLDQIF